LVELIDENHLVRQNARAFWTPERSDGARREKKAPRLFESIHSVVPNKTTRRMAGFLYTHPNIMKTPKQFCLGLILIILASPFSKAADFVGSKTCAGCHKKEYAAWQGSHHDLAMQHANASTVLGDFDNASFEHFGVTSRFYKKDGAFFVNTEGSNGEQQDYQVQYVFGVDPLQQYLVEFPGGRLQALSLAWDARLPEQGGQRWFHLYPNEKIAHDDELHWTRLRQNWNNMCAECHSTNFNKKYDTLTKKFSSTWSEINVACEACHGAGSNHTNWANKNTGWQSHSVTKGWTLQLNERAGVQWLIDDVTNKPQRSVPRSTSKEIEMCARCHARRSAISKRYQHGERFLDHYRPALLMPDLYHVDGQINDEVYVYGSFLQSKMYQSGVTCSDCHEPHSLKPRLPGNGVCLQCHQSDKYNTAKHHFHAPKTIGGSCIECHMPAKNYMVVDARHDHSLRIPRPDLSLQLDTPNACNNCHSDKSVNWAVEHFEKWYMQTLLNENYVEKLGAAQSNTSAHISELAKMIQSPQVPAIVRATGLAVIRAHLNGETARAIEDALHNEDPLLRVNALSALEYVPLNARAPLVLELLDDPVRAVRIEAGRLMAGMQINKLSVEQRRQLTSAWREFIDAQTANAERPEAQINLGNYYVAQGNLIAAQQAYQTAIELEPTFIPAYINLADAYRHASNEQAAFSSLLSGIKIAPNNGALQHALGLSLVRQKKLSEAVVALGQAAKAEPSNDRYAYVYAVALHSAGKTDEAINVLERAFALNSRNKDILAALISYNRNAGNSSAAMKYEQLLNQMSPH